MFDLQDPKYVAALATIVAAVVGGVVSLAGILIAQRKTRQTAERIATLQRQQAVELEQLKGAQGTMLETIKTRLGEERDERAARRDYEYDARRRLYEQCDPLLFQFVDLSENALGRIENLALACRDRSLRPDGTGWLDHEGYFFVTTLYRLLVPCVVFQLLQRRLTLLDLRLDSRITTQFALCRMLYLTFRNDWNLAQTPPALAYDPDHKDAATLRLSEPWVYRRQGIYAGHLDLVVDALVVTEPGQPARFVRYGEFAVAYKDETSALHKAFAPVVDLFFGFHPSTRPVLWRILLAQACIYRAVRLSGDLKSSYTDAGAALAAALNQPADWLEWRSAADRGTPAVDENPAAAVATYLKAAAERISPSA